MFHLEFIKLCLQGIFKTINSIHMVSSFTIVSLPKELTFSKIHFLLFSYSWLSFKLWVLEDMFRLQQAVSFS